MMGAVPYDFSMPSEATAFLLMPFDPELDWIRGVCVAAGEDVNVRVERADDIFAAGVIVDQIKQRIRQADAVIAVCTGRNPNVFYELGIAESRHRPILVAQQRSDLPFDIQHFRVQFYGGSTRTDNWETLRERVASALRETIPPARRTPSQAPSRPLRRRSRMGELRASQLSKIEQEKARRADLLAKLRQEYILSHNGISPQTMAGTQPLPKSWVEARLNELGEKWRQEEYF